MYAARLIGAAGAYVLNIDALPTVDQAHAFLAGRVYAIPAPPVLAPLAPGGDAFFDALLAAHPALAHPEIVREIAERLTQIAASPFFAAGLPGAAAWQARAQRLLEFVQTPAPAAMPLLAYVKRLFAASPLVPQVLALAAPLRDPIDVQPGIACVSLDEHWRLIQVRIRDMLATMGVR